MIDDFLIRAGMAALGVALAAAPLGCVVIWRRMAYFGDATAHAALFGVALALLTAAPLLPAVLLAALAMAALAAGLTRRGVGSDTALGVLSHGALALGLLAVALVPGPRVDLETVLMGDILTVGWWDVAVAWLAAGAAGVAVWRFARPVVLTSLDRDLARAEGIDPAVIDRAVYLSLAAFVAVGLKIAGVLLIAALLVIPAAAARPISRAPLDMVMKAAMISGGSAILGFALSWVLDTATGPTVVGVAFAVFSVIHLARGRRPV